jgi:threonine dehydratase
VSYVPLPLAEIEAARERIAGSVVRTPLVRLQHDGPGEVFLKLENLQPIGSFKLRGAGNALALADHNQLAAGIWTASAGNMAQAAAWHARERGLPCTVVVPETAPRAKLDAIERLGGEIVAVPFETWWETFRTRSYPGINGFFVHPFSDPAVMAGNGTIGLEIAAGPARRRHGARSVRGRRADLRDRFRAAFRRSRLQGLRLRGRDRGPARAVARGG